MIPPGATAWGTTLRLCFPQGKHPEQVAADGYIRFIPNLLFPGDGSLKAPEENDLPALPITGARG
jgi:hypothetical protein